ncbi:hypothetical protein HOLleu_01648 [Holothuria leucospilota]|uniref:Uncharacterized protein n=1 Tax=Holothuria leucospilota TaxID=206669 RepID=A0A9Q1CPM2_HOLLE|nr:hypothetical protein HOLleu_01648 [Holothuria leucospilota]
MAFGSIDSGDEVLKKFYSLHQREGNKASEYLLRLQQLLRKRKLFQMHKISGVYPAEVSSAQCAKISRDIERAEKMEGQRRTLTDIIRNQLGYPIKAIVDQQLQLLARYLREPRFDLDKIYGVSPDNQTNEQRQNYMEELRVCLENAYHLGEKQPGKLAANNKRRYDLSVRANQLEVGNEVLVRN